MAVTQNLFTGNGSTTNFSFTFPYIKQADVKAKIDGVNTTGFTLANATTVSFTTAPSNGAAIIIFRDTDNDEKTATFFAGSAVKAEDLNNNFDQVLFTAQEVDNNALQSLGGTMSGDLNFGQNANIVFEGATDNANETTLTVTDPTADRTITLPNVTGTVVTTGDTGTVATGMIADSAITSAKISDGTIATGDIANDAITTAKISDGNVTTALIADTSVTTAKLASNAVTTAKITDANVTTAKIANDAVTAAKIVANAVGSSEIAANAVTSSELADASVDTAAIVDANVTTVKVADAAITTAKINDSAVTSAKIGSNQVVEAKIADNAVTTAKIPDSGVTTPKIADNAVTNVKLADAELRELATMGSTTASALADLTQAEVQILDGATVSTSELNILDGVTANSTEINQLDGNTLTNSFTANSTTQYPSSNAISGYVLGLMDNLGGFVAIANENSFPTTNPDPSDDAGTVVSISDAGGLVVSASGTASGQTTGGTAVTITGFPTALQSSTLPAGQGLQVVSTSTLNTYTYHKVLGTDADIAQLNDDVNDFFARYRIGSSNPSTDLDAGDLFFNTSTGKMLVYDTTVSAWEEVQAVGSYFINTLSSSGGTGGGSATFNGSAYRFTLSNPGSVAQQHIVSINGVIQKPNSGTSQPSEGFVIDNADIILAAAPATGSEFFIVTVGTSVNIGTPSNDTINNAMVKADAAIAGTKISPNFGSQNVLTTGNCGIGSTAPGHNLEVKGSFPDFAIVDSDTTNDKFRILHNGGATQLQVDPNNVSSGSHLLLNIDGSERFRVDASGRLLVGTTTEGEATADNLTIADSGHCGITLRSGTSSVGAIFFSDATSGADEYRGVIQYDHNGDYFKWVTAGAERMRIDASGNLFIGGTTAANSDIALNADGTATFAGKVQSKNSTNIAELAAGASTGFRLLQNGSTANVVMGWDGSATFAGLLNVVTAQGGNNVAVFESSGANSYGLKVKAGGAGSANYFADFRKQDNSSVFKINGDSSIVAAGSATFAGNVTANGGVTVNGGLSLTTGFYYRDDSGSNGLALYKDGSAQSNRNVFIKTDGSATFNGGITTQDNIAVSRTLGTSACYVGQLNGSDTSSINANGSATFASYNDSSASGFGVNINVNANTGDVRTQTQSTASQYTQLYGAYYGSSRTFQVLANGNVANTNNSYGSISDIKLKENIVDASSQWNDIKDIRVRNYNFIEGQTHTQIGVVAQEIEAVSPGLVSESPDLDADGNDLGTVTKSVNYSVLYMKAVKALQEAIAKIETLETQNASLEARLTALEGGS